MIPYFLSHYLFVIRTVLLLDRVVESDHQMKSYFEFNFGYFKQVQFRPFYTVESTVEIPALEYQE